MGIEEAFAQRFVHWDLRLPSKDVAARRPGAIVDQGWSIAYIWGREGDEEYLEYFAQHRMTDDRHCRIWESGRAEDLEAPSSMMAFPANASPEDEARIQAEYFERNQRIYDDLGRRGLLISSPSGSSGNEINRFLRSGGLEES